MSDFHRVVVTGGAGFIGSNFVRLACRRHPDWQIVVLDKLTYAGNRDNIVDLLTHRTERSDPTRASVTLVEGDIADPQVVKMTVEGADAIINFAAESHVDRSLMDPRPFVTTNVEGTLVLLEAAREAGVKRFLHVSTDEVYGDLVGSDHHSLEGDPQRPRSPYAATKAGAEHLVFAYGTSYGLDVVLTRGSNTYGPYQYPEKIIPLFITNALQDKPLPLYGKGTAVRDYLHAEDHCTGIDYVLHHGESGHAYNVGARLEISGNEVARMVIEILGKSEDLITFVADRPGHDYRYSVDPSKLEALGWQRKWTFQTGLEATVTWYQDNQPWWETIRAKQTFQTFQEKWYTQRPAEAGERSQHP